VRVEARTTLPAYSLRLQNRTQLFFFSLFEEVLRVRIVAEGRCDSGASGRTDTGGMLKYLILGSGVEAAVGGGI
jgi:hypothetical protein